MKPNPAVSGCAAVAVLDFDSQYNPLIVERLRGQGVRAFLLPHGTPVAELGAISGLVGIVFSGGHKFVNDSDAYDCAPGVLEIGVPILGICYGMQLIAKKLGGSVAKNDFGKECGLVSIEVLCDCPLFTGLPARQSVWMRHCDHVAALPTCFRLAARSASGQYAAAFDPARHIYAVQFHPEANEARENGTAMFANFVHLICGVAGFQNE